MPSGMPTAIASRTPKPASSAVVGNLSASSLKTGRLVEKDVPRSSCESHKLNQKRIVKTHFQTQSRDVLWTGRFTQDYLSGIARRNPHYGKNDKYPEIKNRHH
jgi:hypothetical protein